MAAALILLGASSASAAPAEPMPSGPLAKLRECQAISQAEARLACFDSAAAAIAAAASKNDLVVMDREDIRETRRSLFGFSFPKLPIFGGGKSGGREKIAPVDQIESTITFARANTLGLWRLGLADESEWETIEQFRSTIPQNGDKIDIKRNVIGTYFLRVAGGKGVKAIRRR